MPSFLFNVPFPTPYYEGSGTSGAPSSTTEVALSGHAYRIDWSSEIPLRHVSIPILRQQQDTSKSPGEQSINPESLWRRVGESWHTGAGQTKFDRPESNNTQFRDSKGIDIWSRWEITLLHDTESKSSSATTNQHLAVADDYLYMIQGGDIKFTQDITPLSPSFTTLTGDPATAPSSITSNGNRVWTAHGSDGVYMTTKGDAATASHITGSVTLVDYVKNRVMAAFESSIYDITALAVGSSGALPAALFTHGNTDWRWVAFAESQSHIYAAGFSGDKSLIYSIEIKPDGTALDAPVVAGSLPEGETITGLYGYLGRFLALGTNKGFRLAFVSGDGALQIGSLIQTPQPVRAFEGQSEFIWYGLANFTDDASGLGRMSTAVFSDLNNFVPAYASDLMVEGVQAAITSIVTFQNLRVFAVNNAGIYAEHESRLVPSGHLDTGAINYGLTELKTALWLDLQYTENDAPRGAIGAHLSTDNEAYEFLGSYFSTGIIPSTSINEKLGYEFELRLVIDRDTLDDTKAPSILSWLLRVQPRPVITNIIITTIFVAPDIESMVDTTIQYDTLRELDFIERVNQSKEVVVWQEGTQSYTVIVDDYEMNIVGLVDDEKGMVGFNGSCMLKLKRV